MASTADRKVIAYVADITDVKNKLKQLQQLNTRVAGGIGRDLGQGLKQVGTSLGQVKTTETRKGLDDLSGTSLKTSKTLRNLDGSLVQVTKTTKVNSEGVAKVTTSYKDLSKNTVSLRENMARLAKRALITIPIWLALRGAIMGTFRTISDGLGTIAKQDKAFQKARRNLEATASSQQELANQYAKLQKETLRLSLTTGKSVEELTHAFQKFATVGFDAETSFAGMIASTKLAVVEFGDATETANAFARAMRVLTDTSAGAKSEAQQINEAIALTDQLWQTNAFEIKEFTQNLLKFASVGKSAGISTQEIITLLATLSTGGLANRAGRLLRTTILKALQNLDEVALRLNLHINPAVDSTFDVVLKLVGALEKLSSGQTVPKELADVLGDLFSVRATEVLASLKVLKNTLQDNAKVTPDIQKLDKTFDTMTETTGVLVDRFKNLNTELGKAFVVGLVGGDDFRTSLIDIVAIQKDLIEDAKLLGITLRGVGSALKEISNIIGKTFAGQLFNETIGEVLRLVQEVDNAKASLDDFSSSAEQFRDSLAKALSGDLSGADLQRVVDGLQTRLKVLTIDPELDRNVLQKALDYLNKQTALSLEAGISKAFENQLNSTELQELIDKFKMSGEQLFNLDNNTAKEMIKALNEIKQLTDDEEKAQNRINSIRKSRQEYEREETNIRKELEVLDLSALDIEKRILQYRIEQNSHTENELELQRELISHLERVQNIELKRARAQGLISNQLEMLKLQGATEIQLLKTERTLENMYNINQDRNSQLQYELNLQRELTKERLNQNQLSSESVKLAEIAQKEGLRSANAIAKFLSGDLELRAFESGSKFGSLRKTLEEYFGSEVAQREASDFLFKGRGTSIPIQERTAIEGFRPISPDAIKLPKIETNIETVKIDLKQALSNEQLSSKILSNLSEALQNNVVIKESIEEIIENY